MKSRLRASLSRFSYHRLEALARAGVPPALPGRHPTFDL